MRKAMAAIGVVLVLGGGSAWGQVPYDAFRDMGGPRHGMPCCDDMGPHFWVGADYLRWWFKPGPLGVPLVTTGAVTDPVPGALGQPGTRVLFGQDSLHYDPLSGVRGNLGWWCGCEGIVGFDFSGLYFCDRATSDGFASSAGGATLFVPINRADLGSVPGAIPVAGATAGGNISVASSTQLWGGEANMLANICRRCGCELDLLFGFRYLQLNEDLEIATASTGVAATTTLDTFDTRNQFYGGQVGLKLLWRGDRLSAQAVAKVAVGNTHRVVDISGNSTVNGASTPGGIFSQPSNIGERSSDTFGLVPQGELKVGFELFPNVHVTAGYDFLYWNRVLRPGDQIDSDVNTTQRNGGALVGAARPAPQFNSSEFWAHGFNLGVEFRW